MCIMYRSVNVKMRLMLTGCVCVYVLETYVSGEISVTAKLSLTTHINDATRVHPSVL